MDTLVQDGNVLTLTATAQVVTGKPVLVGGGPDKLLVVPVISVESGEEYTADILRVHELDKESTAVFIEGDWAYWDDSSKKFDESGAGRFPAGYCVENAPGSTTSVKVKLVGYPVKPVS